MFNSIGPLEIGLVLLIVLVIFGPKRLPGLGKQIGTGMREFKDSITGDSKDDDEPSERASLAEAPAAAPVDAKPAADPVAAPAATPSTGEAERAAGLGDDRD